MDSNVFQEYMGKKGYRISGKAAYGMYSEYPVTFTQMSGSKWKIVFAATAFSWKEIQKELNRELKGVAVFSLLDGQPVLTVNVKDADTQNVDEAMRKALSVFKSNHAEPINTCGFCGRGNCDAIMIHQGFYRPVHDACCNGFVEKAEKDEMRNNVNGSFFLGLIGAILGAVVGAVPSVLTILFADRIYAILFALIPMCIAFGYKLLKGKRGPAAMVLTVLLSVIDVYLMEIIVVCIQLTTELGLPFGSTVSVMLETLKLPEAWVEMTKDCVTSFVFIVVGIYIAWRYISNLNTSPVKEAASLMNTKTAYVESEDGLFETPAQKETAAAGETGTKNYD